MEVQQQTHVLHHNNPYEQSIKSEPSAGESPKDNKSSLSSSLPPVPLPSLPLASQDMLFGVSPFGLPAPFCPQPNNNSELLNHNMKTGACGSNGRASTGDRKRPYPCNLCPSKFGSKMELEEHQNSHTGMKPFECDVCKARFNRRSTLWNHKRIHSDAKPFVCTVCQMTFKWKNSLKCHKEMHLRKNESSSVLDNDLRQLTYATAAKRRLLEQGDGSASASSAASAPLITTSSPKKKANKSSSSSSSSSATATAAAAASQQQQHINIGMQLNQPLHASSLIPPSDHQLDLDTSPLDSLVSHHNVGNSNLLMQICGYGDMDSAPRHATSLLSQMDDSNSVFHGFGDIKGEISNPYENLLYPQFGSGMTLLNFSGLNGIAQQPAATATTQQLPSVHHLTSTSLASVSSDYPLHGSSPDVAPQYVVTTQADAMIGGGGGAAYGQFQLDPSSCVMLAPQDYPSYDFGLLPNQQYMVESDSAPQAPPPQQPVAAGGNDEKVLPFDQW